MSADPALLTGLTCETVVSNDHPDGMVPQSYVYPPRMSLGGCPTSGTSQVSPSAESLDVSFPQSGTPPSSRADVDPSKLQNWAQTVESNPIRRVSSRNSTRTSSAPRNERPASTQGTASNQNMVLQSTISSVAQTKSEQQQQRQALEKLSKAKLEEILLRIIVSQQQDGGNPHSDSKSSQVSQELAHLADEVRFTRSQSHRASQGSTPGVKQCPYDGCDFSGRICDLNKHKKRHEKPYGCTFPKCYKKFGAKSDWKRHENSQHFQREAYRCDIKSSPDEQCGQHYYRAARFQKHLELEHKVTSESVVQIGLDRCKIGKNYQGQFWCGFCRKITALVLKDNAAWDERFSHIASHFEKDTPKKCIDDWICVEENRTKRQLQEDMVDEKDNELDVEEPDDDRITATEGTANCSPDPTPNGSRKRSLSPDTIFRAAAWNVSTSSVIPAQEN
ncbi:hypothetical protein N0V95_003159 [Ascochyta clinopodiicola]|nr:hypothetical protein N0V95_003159 [Ascochyta clinopodiicola]